MGYLLDTWTRRPRRGRDQRRVGLWESVESRVWYLGAGNARERSSGMSLA